MTYNAFVIAPQQKVKALTNSQVIENNDFKQNNAILPQIEPSNSDVTNNEAENDQEAIIGSFKIRFTTNKGIIKEISSEKLHYSPILSDFLSTSIATKLKTYSQDKNTLILYYEGPDLQIKKEVKAIDDNKLTIRIEFFDLSDSSKLNNAQFKIFDIDGHRIKSDKDTLRDSMLLERSVFADNTIQRKNNAFKFSEKENKTELKSVEWFGWRDRYHFAVVIPEFKTSQYTTRYYDEHLLGFWTSAADTEHKSEASKTYAFTLYMGPQDLELMKNIDGRISKLMAFSGNSIIDAIEIFIYKSLLFINKFTKNWGVSIILISLLIYGATYPLTIKSMLSMRRMQELQPKMAELREKYKNDPQKLNTEVVQLYRVHNINPLGGCLPMLLQMPIFISLYQVLWRTHNFEGAKFLWIKDLSMPDKLFVFNANIPFIGNEFNILPVLMMFIMFFLQKLSSKSMVITDPSQEMQQKMMTFIFPVFIGGIFYHFASGLTLYFTIFYLMSTLTQYKMSKVKKI